MAVLTIDRPPAGLQLADVKTWRRLREILLRREAWDGAAPELLAELVRALVDLRAARARTAARVELDDAEAFYSRGSRGQLVPHPDVLIAKQLLADVRALADVLLLSPQAARRAGLGVVATLEDEFSSLLRGS
jgi:phage terminase small subunit